MKTLLVVSLVAAAMLATPAQAIDGNELYKWGSEWKRSDTENSRDSGSFTGYIQGTIDLHTDLSDPEIKFLKATLFCLPDNVKLRRRLRLLCVIWRRILKNDALRQAVLWLPRYGRLFPATSENRVG